MKKKLFLSCALSALFMSKSYAMPFYVQSGIVLNGAQTSSLNISGNGVSINGNNLSIPGTSFIQGGLTITSPKNVSLAGTAVLTASYVTPTIVQSTISSGTSLIFANAPTVGNMIVVYLYGGFDGRQNIPRLTNLSFSATNGALVCTGLVTDSLNFTTLVPYEPNFSIGFAFEVANPGNVGYDNVFSNTAISGTAGAYVITNETFTPPVDSLVFSFVGYYINGNNGTFQNPSTGFIVSQAQNGGSANYDFYCALTGVGTGNSITNTVENTTTGSGLGGAPVYNMWVSPNTETENATITT